MAKKSRKKPTEMPEAEAGIEKNVTGGNAARWLAIGFLVLGTGVFLYASFGDRAPSSRLPASGVDSASAAPTTETRQTEKRFRYYESEEEARPFPVTLPPSHFRNQGIAHAYEVAKEIPGVLAQQPCLCGCDNSSDDHWSLLDCYADEHASTCAVCLKEAILAEQMTEAGKSAAEIREAILRHDFSEVSIGN